MATQCSECKVDLIDAKVFLKFTPVTSTEDPKEWSRQDVIAGICPKCNRVNFRIDKPQHFKKWLESETQRLA
jgi:Zn finger protein HypA/HybF involved in hydrogenase expression